jgi:hypothetical protein
VFYRETLEGAWVDMGLNHTSFVIMFSPDAAVISNDNADAFTFDDVFTTDSYDCSTTTFTGTDADYEPIEFSHVFYYGNGRGPDVRPTGYAISVYYISLDLKLVHIIY